MARPRLPLTGDYFAVYMISLVHQTVFVHIPKCGGQSVEEAFCADLGLDWNLHRHLLLLMHRPQGWPSIHPRLAHLRAAEYRDLDYMPHALWQRFYKFSVVRNPYRRVESAWRYLRHGLDFPEFVKQVTMGELTLQGFLDPAMDYLTDQQGVILVDDIWKLEELATAWPKLAHRAGIADQPLGHRNASRGKRPQWTQKAVNQVRRFYAEDFSRLSYDPVATMPEITAKT